MKSTSTGRPPSTPTSSPRAEDRAFKPLSQQFAEQKAKKAGRRVKGEYGLLERQVLSLVERERVDELARSTGFTQRTPKQLPPFPFAICCALAAAVEERRGFATVWRLLAAAAGIEVARSAVTQRFGKGSAEFLKALFLEALPKVPVVEHPELLGKLEDFTAVLADDGSVLRLKPLLAKLFPGTRTNHTQAAAKLHAQADIIHRRIVRVVVTGERDSEREVARQDPIQPGALYIRDLGYTNYDDFADIVEGGGHLLMRLKDDANPTVVRVRHGIRRPMQSTGIKLNDVKFTSSRDTFDVDAEFKTKRHGSIVLRVVGEYNRETDKYHCYLSTLPPEDFTVEELSNLYSLRWVIELLFKFLKSSCHLDHLETSDPDAVRTHLYASLLAATIMYAIAVAAAQAAGIHPSEISILSVGIAAPMLVIPLLLLWLRRKLSYDELAALVLRTVAVGCRNQNPGRTRIQWGALT